MTVIFAFPVVTLLLRRYVGKCDTMVLFNSQFHKDTIDEPLQQHTETPAASPAASGSSLYHFISFEILPFYEQNSYYKILNICLMWRFNFGS